MPIQATRSRQYASSHPLKAVVLVAMLWSPSGVVASTDDAAIRMFSISGFGTLGVVHSSEDRADFTSSLFKPNGAGFTHPWNAAVDSVLGGQLTANLNPSLSAVMQVILEQDYDNRYLPQLEWANIKYQITPDLGVRIGRIVVPAFLLSDTREVGYTYAWVRPPLELYNLMPISSSDGLDVSYRVHVGDVANTVQLNTGRDDNSLPHGRGNVAVRDEWGISDVIEYGPLTVHFAYRRAHLTVASVQPLFDAFRQFGPQGITIADRYNLTGKAEVLVTIGASYDPGPWFVMSEWGRNDTHSVGGKRTASYISGGYRFAKLTPYLTYAITRAASLADPGLNVAALPPILAGPASGLNAALNSALSATPDQSTLSIGGRWDLLKNTDLKLQFDHTRNGAGSSGVLTNIQPGFQLGGMYNLLSITIDFVF